MRNTDFIGAAHSCFEGTCKSLASLLLVLSAIAFLFTGPSSTAQDKSSAVLPAPSAGRAIVCVYREYRFTGSASHDEIFVNETHLGKLLNSEYVFTEVPAGTVVIAGLPKMYYGSLVMSAGAALNDVRKKENERARFEAEAGKTYYFKWTAGTMATMIKVTPVDPAVGAKAMSKLHLSKPPNDAAAEAPEAKDSGKPAAK